MLVVVVGLLFWSDLILIGVGGLDWWAVECLRSGVDGDGVCGYVSVGVGGPGWHVDMGCRLRGMVGWMFLAVGWECLPSVVLPGFVGYVLGSVCGDEGSYVDPMVLSPIMVGRVAIANLLWFLGGAFRLECVGGFVGLSASTHPRNRLGATGIGLVHATVFMWGGSVIEGGDPHAGRPLVSSRGVGVWGFQTP